MQGQVMEARKIPAGIIWRQVLVVGRKTQFDFKKGMFIGISDFVDFQDHKTMHPED